MFPVQKLSLRLYKLLYPCYVKKIYLYYLPYITLLKLRFNLSRDISTLEVCSCQNNIQSGPKKLNPICTWLSDHAFSLKKIPQFLSGIEQKYNN